MTFKRLSFFLSLEDEREFSSRLAGSFPDIRFRNGDRWRVGENPLKESIDQCGSGTAYIWNPELFPDVPTLETSGWVEGAKTRYVIQFMRSREVAGQIRMGQMAASYEPSSASETAFAKDAFRILKGFGVAKLQSIEVSSGRALGAPSGATVIGPSCAARVQAGAVLSAPSGVRIELVAARAAADT